MIVKCFNMAYGNLPGNLQSKAREEIMKACNWSTFAYFYMKKNGTRGLTDIEENNVAIIFKRYGIDAFTGEKL